MPRPNAATSYSDVELTGVLNTDSLLAGVKWGKELGTSASLTYSFYQDGVSQFADNYSDEGEPDGAYALSSAQKNIVQWALSKWSAVANLTFTQVTDTASNVGTLRFAGYDFMDSDTYAWAYYPDGSPSGGDVWIGSATEEARPTPGSNDAHTFLHEIGHALGLKHPFAEDPDNPDENVLPARFDNPHYTVMSYNTDEYSFLPTTPMLLDIAAMQYLYGANMTWQTGNNVYSWGANQKIFETIWDAGGTDTLSAANRVAKVTLNLNEGSFSSIGAVNNLAIAYNAKIENATGSAFADTLIGNALQNVLTGGAGNDSLSGGAGNDTLKAGTGVDQLTGGTGNDVFDFNALNELSLGNNRDVITDLKAGDRIDLADIDAKTASAANDAFTFIGTKTAFTGDASGLLRFSNGTLYGSTDADTAAEFEIRLTGVTALTAASLVV